MEKAIIARSFVREEQGRWWVHMLVGFTDGTLMHHRIRDFNNRQLAERAADWAARAANRTDNRLARP